MGDTAGSKRCRVESAEFPETKRFKEADLILEILDGDGDDAGVDPAVGEALDDFIRSLEEEFTETPPLQPQVELGYLLEASDDELGLPPPAAVGTSSTSPSAETEGGIVAEVVDEESIFGHVLWGFEEETLGPYEGLEFGILESDGGIFESGDYLCGDGGLSFECSDLVSGPSDYSELTWQTESRPLI